MAERAHTAAEYAGLVDQVIFELVELRATADFDVDIIDADMSLVERLLEELRELRDSMADGSYLFGRTDLPFMQLLKKADEKTLPFIRLFYQINRTHKLGLDTGSE
ncbi:MAG: general secretion pathway protein GspF [Gammaproteobacteria bacterium]|jgi:hypothetical protein